MDTRHKGKFQRQSKYLKPGDAGVRRNTDACDATMTLTATTFSGSTPRRGSLPTNNKSRKKYLQGQALSPGGSCTAPGLRLILLRWSERRRAALRAAPHQGRGLRCTGSRGSSNPPAKEEGWSSLF